MENEIKKVVRIISEIATHVFWQPRPLGFFLASEPMSSYEANWRSAFKFFLSGYAFEHQGRSPHFSKFALQALDAYTGDLPDVNFPEMIWKAFLDKGRFSTSGKGAAPSNNPLCHPSSSRFCSASNFVIGLNGEHSYNIVKWALSMARNGQIETAHTELMKIRGVGPKIASLFLRDIVFSSEIDENDVGDKKCLHPIDIWTRRAAESFAPDISMKPLSTADCAQILVDVSESAGVPCALTNSGLWTLGSQLVKNADRFTKILSNTKELLGFLNTEAKLQEERSSAIRTVLSKSIEVYSDDRH